MPMLSEAQIQQQASQQVMAQLAQWEKEGLLVKSGNVYKISIRYENGQLMVNGKNMSGLATVRKPMNAPAANSAVTPATPNQQAVPNP